MPQKAEFRDSYESSSRPADRRSLYTKDAVLRIYVGQAAEYDPRLGVEVERWQATVYYTPSRDQDLDHGGTRARDLRTVPFFGEDLASAVAAASRFIEANGAAILAEIRGELPGKDG